MKRWSLTLLEHRWCATSMNSDSGRGRSRVPDDEIWVVGSVRDGVAVLVEDLDLDEEEVAGERGEATRMVVEVAVVLLGDQAVEGAVLRVPVGDVGEPMWEAAQRDRALEAELEQRPPDVAPRPGGEGGEKR